MNCTTSGETGDINYLTRVGFELPEQSHASFEVSALPPSHHGRFHFQTLFKDKMAVCWDQYSRGSKTEQVPISDGRMRLVKVPSVRIQNLD